MAIHFVILSDLLTLESVTFENPYKIYTSSTCNVHPFDGVIVMFLLLNNCQNLFYQLLMKTWFWFCYFCLNKTHSIQYLISWNIDYWGDKVVMFCQRTLNHLQQLFLPPQPLFSEPSQRAWQPSWPTQLLGRLQNTLANLHHLRSIW